MRGDEPAQHRLEAGHEAIELQDHRLQDLLAAEGRELSGEPGGALARLLDLEHVGALRIVGVHVAQQHLAEPEDGRQQVVEVVRDAAGQLTDDLQFLGLPELFFELPLLRDVAADRQDQLLAADVDGGVRELQQDV